MSDKRLRAGVGAFGGIVVIGCVVGSAVSYYRCSQNAARQRASLASFEQRLWLITRGTSRQAVISALGKPDSMPPVTTPILETGDPPEKPRKFKEPQPESVPATTQTSHGVKPAVEEWQWWFLWQEPSLFGGLPFARQLGWQPPLTGFIAVVRFDRRGVRDTGIRKWNEATSTEN